MDEATDEEVIMFFFAGLIECWTDWSDYTMQFKKFGDMIPSSKK